ncbi:MAG: low specificity L-threonine aldolase [Synechococcaceae cyanobacterium SM2_3_60]|nr:low specificity L-threonine aldolase [Synechococcaceae cyanobacterium SM2_3_60]
MNFCSDNVTGIAPEILTALVEANNGRAMPYGQDELTAQVEPRFAEVFEHDVTVALVSVGSAANALALAQMVPPHGAIYCHAEAHIHCDECGAPEFYTHGAKLLPLAGEHGRIEPGTLQTAIQTAGLGVVHHVQPAALSLTNATEAGTIYTPAQVDELATIAHQHGLTVHMDGARFANAVVGADCTPAALTWQAGVDVLSFGATKNGAMAAEAVVFFTPELAAQWAYRRKRAGHLWSKMRFLAAQWLAYFEGDLWQRNARHANTMAQQLAQGLSSLPGVRLLHPVEANEVFIALPEAMVQVLEAAGFRFYHWSPGSYRLVMAFDTHPADLERFLAIANQAHVMND